MDKPGHWTVARQMAGLAITTVIATAFMLSSGVSAGPGPKDGNVAATAGTSKPNIEKLFRSDCAVCHGVDGHGTSRAPTLVGVGRSGVDFMVSTGRMPLVEPGRRRVPNQPIQPLPNISQGDANLTPNRSNPAYDPATISALATYVSELTGGGPDIPTVAGGQVAMGGVLYRQQCAACHSWSGDGGALLHREAPPLHQATQVQTAEAIRLGPGQMPKFSSAALTNNQVADVASYVDYLRDPDDRGGQGLGHIGPVAEGAVALLGILALLLFTRWIGDRA